MEALFLLIPLSVAAVLALIALLWWATSAGQFDDLEGPAHQVLMDDDSARDPGKTAQHSKAL